MMRRDAFVGDVTALHFLQLQLPGIRSPEAGYSLLLLAGGHFCKAFRLLQEGRHFLGKPGERAGLGERVEGATPLGGQVEGWELHNEEGAAERGMGRDGGSWPQPMKASWNCMENSTYSLSKGVSREFARRPNLHGDQVLPRARMSGMGSDVLCYDVSSGRLLAKKQVMPDGIHVHGLTTSSIPGDSRSYLVSAYGDRYLRVRLNPPFFSTRPAWNS